MAIRPSKCQPHGGSRGKVRGSPPVRFIHSSPGDHEFLYNNFRAIHRCWTKICCHENTPSVTSKAQHVVSHLFNPYTSWNVKMPPHRRIPRRATCQSRSDRSHPLIVIGPNERTWLGRCLLFCSCSRQTPSLIHCHLIHIISILTEHGVLVPEVTLLSSVVTLRRR